jgi:hypothetical protein
MNGADHVNRSQILIGRPGARDLENGRPAVYHADGMNGVDSDGVDWLMFPHECFF